MSPLISNKPACTGCLKEVGPEGLSIHNLCPQCQKRKGVLDTRRAYWEMQSAKKKKEIK